MNKKDTSMKEDEALRNRMMKNTMSALVDYMKDGGDSKSMKADEVIVASSKYGEFMKEKALARKIRMRLSELDSHEKRSIERLGVGIDSYLNLVGTQADKYVVMVKGGLELGDPHIKPMPESDRKVVKATRKELEKITKNYAKREATNAKGKDSSGYNIKDYQQAEARIIAQFIDSLPDKEIYFEDIQELLASQHKLNLVISSNNGKVIVKDFDEMGF